MTRLLCADQHLFQINNIHQLTSPETVNYNPKLESESKIFLFGEK